MHLLSTVLLKMVPRLGAQADAVRQQDGREYLTVQEFLQVPGIKDHTLHFISCDSTVLTRY